MVKFYKWIKKQMKIAIVNNSDIYGGAAKAAYRLHKGLLKNGIDSRMFVLRKYSDDETIIAPKHSFLLSKIRAFIDQLPLKRYNNRISNNFSINWLPFSPILKDIIAFDPDIIHLHWINNGMLSLRNFKNPVLFKIRC